MPLHNINPTPLTSSSADQLKDVEAALEQPSNRPLRPLCLAPDTRKTCAMPSGVYDVPWRKTPIVIVGRLLRIFGWNLGLAGGAAISGGCESWVSIADSPWFRKHVYFRPKYSRIPSVPHRFRLNNINANCSQRSFHRYCMPCQTLKAVECRTSFPDAPLRPTSKFDRTEDAGYN